MATILQSNTDGLSDRAAGSLGELRPRFRECFAEEDGRRAAEVLERARQAVGTQLGDGSWADIDYADEDRGFWKPADHLQRARALASPLISGAEREACTAVAAKALRYWFARDFICSNWWFNQIGVPAPVAECLLLLGPAFPDPRLGRQILERSGPFIFEREGTRPRHWTGANQLWMAWNIAMRSVLFDDREGLERAVADAAAEIRVSHRNEEGLQADGSFHQHGPLLYNNGYGLAFLTSCHNFVRVFAGTAWALPQEKVDLLARMVLEGNRWMVRGDTLHPGSRDRETTRHPSVRGARLVPIVETLAGACPSRRAELEELAAALRRGEAPGALDGARIFPRSDFFARHHPGFSIAVRMSSVRTKRSEYVNLENPLGHHLADGFMTLMRWGAEYDGVYPLWDWQKLPGITALQTRRPLPTYALGRWGSSAFAGGVCEGRLGACAQDLADPHLQARKAWFFGTKAAVCLGSAISSSFAGEVVTVLDQSFCRGAVTLSAAPWTLRAGDGGETAEIRGPGWIRHDGWAFHVLTPASVRVTVEKRSASWQRIGGCEGDAAGVIFQAWISHGEAPHDETYAYAVFPPGEQEEAEKEEALFEVLANTANLQAVGHREPACLQAFFRTPGSLEWPGHGRIAASGPCGLMLMEASGAEPLLYVADVSQTERDVRIRWEAPDLDLRLESVVQPPRGDFAGDTVKAVWSRQ